MGFSDFLSALGQGLQGQSGQRYDPMGDGSQSQGAGRYNPLANWSQPTGSGLASAQAPQLPMHNSGLLQSFLTDPSGGAANPMDGGNGLHAILMRLGVFH